MYTLYSLDSLLLLLFTATTDRTFAVPVMFAVVPSYVTALLVTELGTALFADVCALNAVSQSTIVSLLEKPKSPYTLSTLI